MANYCDCVMCCWDRLLWSYYRWVEENGLTDTQGSYRAYTGDPDFWYGAEVRSELVRESRQG